MKNFRTNSNKPSLNRTALSATVHCLSGCAIGEVSGMMIGTSMGWSNNITVMVSVVLAFFFGYALTLLPILRTQVDLSSALKLVFASDTLSILIMEIVDNGIMLIIPGAMDASLTDGLFWSSMFMSLVLAGAAAFPLNRWLIKHNQGHAMVHRFHNHDASEMTHSVNPAMVGHVHHGHHN